MKPLIDARQEQFQNALQRHRSQIEKRLEEFAAGLSSIYRVNLQLTIDPRISYGKKLDLVTQPQQIGTEHEAVILLNPEYAFGISTAANLDRILTAQDTDFRLLVDTCNNAQLIVNGSYKTAATTDDQIFRTENGYLAIEQPIKQHIDQLIARLPRYGAEVSAGNALVDLRSYFDQLRTYSFLQARSADFEQLRHTAERIEEARSFCQAHLGIPAMETLDQIVNSSERENMVNRYLNQYGDIG